MELLGLLVLVPAALVYAWCFGLFAFRGRGTPLPFAPPTQFVNRGPYRWCRNPMALSVIGGVAGTSLYLGTPVGLVISAGLAMVLHLWITRVEEPALKVRFGESYDSYCKQVPRWLPWTRRHPPDEQRQRTGIPLGSRQNEERRMSDLKRFIHGCELALRTADPPNEIARLLAELIRESTALEREIEAMGAPLGANARLLHRASDLTILDIRLRPGFFGAPHDHLMWVVAGAYLGQEDNVLYRREPDHLVETGRRSLVAPDVLVLAEDCIHSVHNPLATAFASLQVCGGDFVAVTPRRSQWDPKTFERRAFSPPRE